MAIIKGTRTAIYVGRNGTGANCYGNGTSNQSLHGTYGPDGALWCYDPTTSDKGSHAYPYRYQIWAYDLNDFAAVKAGQKQPWEVVPYAVWPFDLPTPEPAVRLGGIGYDPERQLLYVSQMGADKDGYSYRPVMHALQIDLAGAPITTPVNDPPPPSAPAPPAPPAIVSAVAIDANKVAPQVAGTTTTFTASPTGGVAPHQFKWMVYDGSAWTMGAWTSSNQFAWSPTSANTAYRIGVWVRSAGNAADTAELSIAMPFAITAPAATAPLTAVTLSSDRVAPQPAGTAVAWTASPVGGAGPHQYKWLLFDGASWTTIGNWSTSATLAWTPATANSSYRVGVWVRSFGRSNDAAEAATSSAFAVSSTTSTPPSSAPTANVSAVALSANRVAPQPGGTPVIWTAAPVGGSAHEYKWLLFDGATWTTIGNWSATATLAWTPASANSAYRIGVWVRAAGNGNDAAEAANSTPFAVSSGATAAPAAPVSTATVSAVVLSANRAAPQPAGTAVTWTAVPAGSGAMLYRWWLFDGANWTPSGTWTTANTFTWVPATANAGYRVGVWTKRAANAGDISEASASEPFAIAAGAVVATHTTASTASDSTSGPATAVELSANAVAPVLVGSTVTWTATPIGGAGQHQYKWLLFTGITWVELTGWTDSSSYSWSPVAPGTGYRIGVWVRSAGRTANAAEAAVSVGFPVSG